MATTLVTSLAGQTAVVVQPTKKARSRLIVLCHGADFFFEIPTSVDASLPPIQEMIQYVAERNYVVVCPALYDFTLNASPPTSWGQTFGNAATTTQLSSVITAAQALPGVSTGKFVLAGVSMGNCTTMNYARVVGQTNLAGLFGIVPVCDLGYQYDSNGAATAINAALGSTAGNFHGTFKPVYDPLAIAPSITVPWRGWTNTGDTVSAPPAQAVTLAAAIPSGRGTTESRGAGGHDFSGCAGRDFYAWLDTLTWG